MNYKEKKYILYINPKKSEKLSEPIVDDLTILMNKAISESKKGIMRDDGRAFNIGESFKEVHISDDGEVSTNYDLLLKNGMVTNSLAIHYLKWYRNSIPDVDFNKLLLLRHFYNNNDSKKCKCTECKCK